MKVMKASAGSGKTYNLSKTYIELLLSNEEFKPYRHILAVTFTNKATAEMKARILRDLAELAESDARAESMLLDILHDYSAFAVSTIDKFFQQTLKAFSREIGQFADYKIELDRKSLIHESMDRILDTLSEDKKELIDWLKNRVAEQLALGQTANIVKALYDMGEHLKSEEFRELYEAVGLDTRQFFSKSKVTQLRKECREEIKNFEKLSGRSSKDGKRITFTKTELKNDPALAEIYDQYYSRYITAFLIEQQLFSLGLASEFFREFDSLLKEKNLMCLDESNTILRDIIADSDAPFVYEKIGVRYKHFLLDEFQDTSNIQWVNFLPLLRESEANKGKNLIVGDVKQSIYRFRASDWQLLDKQVPIAFPQMQLEVLACNWRSTKAIVEFNNDLFTYSASTLGLKDLYADVVQIPKTKDKQEGMVKISYCDDQLEKILESVQFALDSGAQLNDIAILVRGWREGGEIADYLIQKGISVISDDSLRIKSAVTVRRLVSLLSAIDSPEDSVTSYLATVMGLDFPETYHSLVDLCECLLRSLREFDADSFDGETLFIQSFMDELQNYTTLYGNNIRSFLAYWKEKEKDASIGSPANSNSVRVMTIHKSKGLEFPYVIFPYLNNLVCYKRGIHWVGTDDDSLPLCSEGIYPVELSEVCSDSLFLNSLQTEQNKQIIDNINIFYVALTRASKSLHIIAKPVSKKFRENVQKGKKAAKYTNFAELLYEYIKAMDEISFGEPYDFSKMEREETKGIQSFAASYESIPLDSRLTASSKANEFFSSEDSVNPMSTPRLAGIVLHELMSDINSASDVVPVVEAAVAKGVIDASQKDWVIDLLQRRIASHPEFFLASADLAASSSSAETSDSEGLSSSGLTSSSKISQPHSKVQVLNEQSIIAADGTEHRPDRAVISESGVLIVDFKFGKPRKEYIYQVKDYISLYRSMGYNNVSGRVWYMLNDDCIVVD